eukprot:30935-Pelagococcus_subviridis.AAC.16
MRRLRRILHRDAPLERPDVFVKLLRVRLPVVAHGLHPRGEEPHHSRVLRELVPLLVLDRITAGHVIRPPGRRLRTRRRVRLDVRRVLRAPVRHPGHAVAAVLVEVVGQHRVLLRRARENAVALRHRFLIIRRDVDEPAVSGDVSRRSRRPEAELAGAGHVHPRLRLHGRIRAVLAEILIVHRRRLKLRLDDASFRPREVPRTAHRARRVERLRERRRPRGLLRREDGLVVLVVRAFAVALLRGRRVRGRLVLVAVRRLRDEPRVRGLGRLVFALVADPVPAAGLVRDLVRAGVRAGELRVVQRLRDLVRGEFGRERFQVLRPRFLADVLARADGDQQVFLGRNVPGVAWTERTEREAEDVSGASSSSGSERIGNPKLI